MKRMIMALIFLSLLVSTFVAGCGIDQRKRDGRTGASPVKVVPLPYEEGPFPPVVQLVRMPPCHGGDRRFESVLGRQCLGSSVGRARD